MSANNGRSAVDIIAAHAANLRYEDLSETTVTRACQVMLDTLGTALGGYQTRLGRLTADYAAQRYPGEEATLVADGRARAPPGPTVSCAISSRWTTPAACRGTWPRSWYPPCWRWASICNLAVEN
jgi:2-methylcitrate dehydratase PrpD